MWYWYFVNFQHGILVLGIPPNVPPFKNKKEQESEKKKKEEKNTFYVLVFF